MSAWTVTSELSLAEMETAHRWLSTESYWAKGQPRSSFDRSVANSLCFALRDREGVLRGFARVISDKATFAYLCDVFVCSTARGQGAGKALMQAVMDHPDLQSLRLWMLATHDAQGLYAQYGFEIPANPERLMLRVDPDLYTRLGLQEA